MANMTTSEVDKFFKDIQKSIHSRETMLRLGGFTIRLIIARTRGRGQGVLNPGGTARKLKRVTAAYAAHRQRLKGKHPQAAISNNSNLTLYGHLLNSLIVKRSTKSELMLGFRGRLQELKAEGQEKQGRRFLVLSGAEMKDAKKFLSDLVASQNR